MNQRTNVLFPARGLRRDVVEEFEQGYAIAQVTLYGAEVALKDCSTYDLMCLAANMRTALSELVQLISRRSDKSATEILRTVATMRACSPRIKTLRRINYVNLGVHNG
ncbi:MAG: hypothetical protein J6B04_03125 [Clostridia bacterium]|nr:hypothetical protein [Clostridia bacterium]